MTYQSHILIGAGIGILAVPFLSSSVTQSAVIISSAALGSLLPDLDHPNSFISHRLKTISHLVCSITSHRGLLHSPLIWTTWIVLCISMTKFYLFNSLFVGLFLGVLSHILADSLTPSGVPFLYPLSKQKISLAKIRTGSGMEYLVSTLFISFSIYMVYLR